MEKRPASAAPSNPSQFDRASQKTGSYRPASNAGSRVGGVPSYHSQTKSKQQPRPYSSNLNPNKTIHDRDQYWQKKMDKSAPYFQNTRVQTCSHILR